MQKKNITRISKNKCVGCSGCYSICYFDAIEMIQDNDGFLFPQIDIEKCTNCGLCYKSCPLVYQNTNNCEPEHILVCQNNDKKILSKSSSGGVFYELAKSVILENGIVYGCAMVDKIAIHIRVDNLIELSKLMGSKYVQSRVDCFRDIKSDLDSGLKVLFSGTPCQVSGLKSFLGKEYSNLVCVDFICHGVPSPLVLKQYFKYIENHYNKIIEDVKFRDKTYGWHNFSLKLLSSDGEIICEPRNKNLYLRAFLANVSLRKSCGSCEFNTVPRNSDITLGDFWGIKNDEKFDIKKGVSVVLLNNIKAHKIFQNLKENFICREISLDDVKRENPFVNGHCILSNKRTEFFKKMNYISIDKNIKKCLQSTPIEWFLEVFRYKVKCIRGK